MAKHVVLDNIAHKNLRVRLGHGAAFGDNVGSVATFPTEFADVQREYPIFFRRDAGGDFYCVALLGFGPDENLYLDGDRWNAWYLPGLIARGPFLIGFQEVTEGGETRREPVIHVDLDSPRVSETEGQRVFLEQGGHSPYLQRITKVLNGLHEGVGLTRRMFEAFLAHKLVAPVDLEVKVTGQEPLNLQGFYTLDREKLAALDAAALHQLHQTGFLHGAYLILASHANLQKLIDRKIQRLQAAAA